ncbi:hypothetical protein B0H19DRAFT_1262009 [Mycena capillaripes]|nr:hypothetical protein B0H19DRAFT_1262009 [Mycena capillaripes]
MRASAAYPKCTPSPWSTFRTNLTRLRMIPVHTLSIVAGPAAHMDSCVAASQGVDGAGYGIRSRTSLVYPPAESLRPRGERASIPTSNAHLRSSPFPPPVPSSPPICRLDSGVSCCSIALLSSFSLLVRRIRDAAVYWIQRTERGHLPLRAPLPGSAQIEGETQVL